MEKDRFIKLIFLIFAIGIFIFQMQNAIEKYTKRPIIQQTSKMEFDEVKKPVIYICQESQFNYTKAKSYGYDTLTRFNTGTLKDSDVITWKGRFGDQSFDKLQRDIYVHDFKDLLVKTGHSVYEEIKVQTDTVFIVHEGFCKKLDATNRSVMLHSTKRYNLYLIDPYLANNLTFPAGENVKVTFGSLGNGYFDTKSYKIEISLYDNRIDDGITCTDYEKARTSFGQCIETRLGESMLNWLGCYLPWFQKSTKFSCEMANKTKMTKTVFNEMTKLINGWKMKSSSACKQPCMTMDFTLKKVRVNTNRIGNGALRCSFKKEVTVFTDVSAYDMFSLVVDLGSSLGLWLGLSALSIFGSLVDYTTIVRNVDKYSTLLLF